MNESAITICPICGAAGGDVDAITEALAAAVKEIAADAEEHLSPEPFTRVLNDCPYCCGVEFELGPRGGASRNITCIGCGARFNIVDHPGVPRFLVNVLSGPAT